MSRKKRKRWYRRNEDRTKGMEVPLIVSTLAVDQYRAANPGKTKMDMLIELYPDIQTALAKFKLLEVVGAEWGGATVKRKLKGFKKPIEITACIPTTRVYGAGKKIVVYIIMHSVTAVIPLSKVEDKIMEELLNA